MICPMCNATSIIMLREGHTSPSVALQTLDAHPLSQQPGLLRVVDTL